MNEKIYKTMGISGACSIAVGVIILVTSIVSGVLLIVSGGRLLAERGRHII